MKPLQLKAMIYFSTMEKGGERKSGCPKEQAKGAGGKSMEPHTVCAPSTMRVSSENESLFLGNLAAPIYKKHSTPCLSCSHPYGTVTPVTEMTTESNNAMQIGLYTFLLTSESVFLSNERMKWQRPMMKSTERMGNLFVQHHWRESVTFKINLILLWKKW